MRVRGDVRCYHCGHVSGTIEGDPHGPPGAAVFTPLNGPPQRASASIRCIRCGGPVYLDELHRVSPSTPAVAVVEPEEPAQYQRHRPKPRWPRVA
jgi:hypothetical protein